jgi:hypothetical protein
LLRNGNEAAALEGICLRCLRPDPAARYATAAELADDLQRYLDDHPEDLRGTS